MGGVQLGIFRADLVLMRGGHRHLTDFRLVLRWVKSRDCPPGPMSALGGSGRAAPKEEVRALTPKRS
jgi:hypothetical protein